MRAHPDSQKAMAAHDCLHYCIPGPADAWAAALYNLLLNNPEGAVSEGAMSEGTRGGRPHPAS